jgi:hypothetical protein
MLNTAPAATAQQHALSQKMHHIELPQQYRGDNVHEMLSWLPQTQRRGYTKATYVRCVQGGLPLCAHSQVGLQQRRAAIVKRSKV